MASFPPPCMKKINSHPTHLISKKPRERERERERWMFSVAPLRFINLGFTRRLYSTASGGGFD